MKKVLLVTACFLLFITFLFFSGCPIPKSVILTLNIVGQGSTIPPVGRHAYPINTIINLSAIPDDNWTFSHWAGDVANPYNANTTIQMNSDKEVTAYFEEETEIKKIIKKVDLDHPLSLYFIEEIIPLTEGNKDELLDMLENGSPLERWAAAYAFQRVTTLPATVLNELEDYLNDSNETIKALIATAFLVNNDVRGKSPLESLLSSDEIMMFSVPPELISEFALAILGIYFPDEYSPAKSFESLTTTVTGGPCDYTVTVKIAFHGDGASQTQLDNWESKAEAIWNGTEGSRPWGGENEEDEDCCTVKFDFIFELITDGATPNDAHVVEVKSVNAHHTSFVYTPLPTPGSTETTTGEFDNLDTGGVVAHEIGHLMGLDDEYHYNEDGDYVNDNPQTEDPQSIMATTSGSISSLPEHIDEIMSDAEIECECDFNVTMTPAYDVNISPGEHTVNGVFVRKDGTVAKGCKVKVQVAGLHNLGPVEKTTDENGKVSYTYQCEIKGHTGLDFITMEGECGASDTVLKQWISLGKIIPIPLWPYNDQRDVPYGMPTPFSVDATPSSAWRADNFAMHVIITEDSTVIYETTSTASVFDVPALQPATTYEVELIPTNTFSGDEGIKEEIYFETKVPTPEYIEPPEDIKVDLSASGTSIRSHEFAKLVSDSILKKGYKQMIFVFGQCYGGGLFADLKDLDKTLLKSAAKWNEASWGNDSKGYDYWLEALRKELAEGDTIARADHDAMMNDPHGPNPDASGWKGHHETPQGLYNGDETMKLTDDASSKHALLFSGSDEPRHKGDIENWEETLTSTPFGFDVISIVGGTKEDLETALASISALMNSNEIFLFMSSGHGSMGQKIATEKPVTDEGAEVIFRPSSEIETEMVKMSLTGMYITFDVYDEGISYNVYLNGLPIGSSLPGVIRTELFVPVDYILWGEDNTLFFEASPIIYELEAERIIYEIFLDTGAIPTINEE